MQDLNRSRILIMEQIAGNRATMANLRRQEELLLSELANITAQIRQGEIDSMREGLNKPVLSQGD